MLTFDRAEQLYGDVFAGRTDYIPLLMGVRCPGTPSREAIWEDTANAVRAAAEAMKPRLAVQDDWLPTVNIGYHQNVVVPSLYGATIACPGGSEPICLPRFASAKEAADFPRPAIDGPAVDHLLRMLRAAKDALPDGIHLSIPPVSSPFDLAQLMLGEEFLFSLVDDPTSISEFLASLTELVISLTRLVKYELGLKPDQYVTNRGIYFPGLRQPCDAIVNLGPDHLRRYVLPAFERLGQAFGALCIHYCTTPASVSHILPVLLECPAVRAVDNWQGPGAFWDNGAVSRMQDRIALLIDVNLTTPQAMDEFLALPPVSAVPRRGGRGLVVSTWAKSVEEANMLVGEWRKRMDSHGR